MASIVAVCGTAIYWAGQRAVRVEQIRELDNLTALARQWIAGSGEPISPQQEAQLRSAADALQTRVTLIGGDGRVSFDTLGAAAAMENHNARPEVVAARSGRAGSHVRHSRTIREGSLLQLTAAQAVGRTVDAVVNEASILELFERAGGGDALKSLRNEAGPPEIRITRDGQRIVYQAILTPTAAGGVLLVLRDVSALANAMQMKTDFVANASHMLRTPIAAIKIAFETLRDVYTEDPPQTERCITIIDEHIRRLEEMLRDLLDLSRVESPDLKPHLTEVAAAELLALLRATMGPVARQKGVALDFVDRKARLVSDERLLSLVLKNLVENSIKFTPLRRI